MNRRTVLAGLLLAGLASCSLLNLEHVQALRDAQDRYSKLVARENLLAMQSVLPGATDDRATVDREDTESVLDPGVEPHDLQEFQRGYQQVLESVEALLQRASPALQEDKLLGSCLTLRVLARWRATFYAHLLRGREMGAADPEPEPSSMTSVWVLAEGTVKQLDAQKVELFPRDRFLLQAMKSLVRYDICYIRAAVDVGGPEWESPAGKAALTKKRCGEIVEADLEMVQAVGKASAQIQRYGFLSRLLMLKTGRTLAVLTFKKEDRKRELGALADRIDALHADYKASSMLQQALRLTREQLASLLPPLDK